MTNPKQSSHAELHIEVRTDRVVVMRVEGDQSHAFASLTIDGRLPQTLRGLIDAVEPVQVVVDVENGDRKTDALMRRVRVACRKRRLTLVVTERPATLSQPV